VKDFIAFMIILMIHFILGGYFIGESIERFKSNKYFFCGAYVMCSIGMMISMFIEIINRYPITIK
jgi:hypothetical protein